MGEPPSAKESKMQSALQRFLSPPPLRLAARRLFPRRALTKSSLLSGNEEALSRAQNLRERITLYNKKYYGPSAESVVSDEEYDSLFQELQGLEARHPSLRTEESPTQLVGAPGSDRSTSVQHNSPMLSLQNVARRADMINLESSIRRLLADHDEEREGLRFSTELKYDGVAISLVYDGSTGEFLRAVTRGDGRVGEDVTGRVLHHAPDLPRKIPLHLLHPAVPLDWIEVRGEIVMSKAEFASVNNSGDQHQHQQQQQRQHQQQQQPAQEAHRFATARNLTAGLLRRDMPVEEVGSEVVEGDKSEAVRLTVMCYSLHLPSDSGEARGGAGETTLAGTPELDTHSGRLGLLEKAGFFIDPYAAIVSGDSTRFIQDIEDAMAHWTNVRDSLPHDIDGLVIKVDCIHTQKLLGSTSRAPRWAVAYKFPPQQAWTELLDISVQVGRTGKGTPVAELAPVRIGGTLVARATLHNFDHLLSMGLRLGDRVRVERRGDVIPAVTGRRDQPMVNEGQQGQQRSLWGVGSDGMPTAVRCPCSEQSVLGRRDDSADLFCNSASCPPQREGRLAYFASKHALDIDGMGPRTVRELVNVGILRKPQDLLRLHENVNADGIMMDTEGRALEGWGVRRTEQLIRAVASALQLCTGERLLVALGLSRVGLQTARALIDHFGSLDAVQSAGVEQLEAVPGLGGILAKHTYTSLRDARDTLDAFRAAAPHVFQPTQQQQQQQQQQQASAQLSQSFFTGKTIVVTGSVQGMSRDQVQAAVRARGGKVATKISDKVAFLVNGERKPRKAGGQSAAGETAKQREAKARGVRIITGQEFVQMLSA